MAGQREVEPSALDLELGRRLVLHREPQPGPAEVLQAHHHAVLDADQDAPARVAPRLHLDTQGELPIQDREDAEDEVVAHGEPEEDGREGEDERRRHARKGEGDHAPGGHEAPESGSDGRRGFASHRGTSTAWVISSRTSWAVAPSISASGERSSRWRSTGPARRWTSSAQPRAAHEHRQGLRREEQMDGRARPGAQPHPRGVPRPGHPLPDVAAHRQLHRDRRERPTHGEQLRHLHRGSNDHKVLPAKGSSGLATCLFCDHDSLHPADPVSRSAIHRRVGRSIVERDSNDTRRRCS
jgi:hypothetical protein